MDKNEILEKSRQENKKQDEYYAEINKSGLRVGMIAVVIVCLALMIIEYAVKGDLESGYIVIITAVNAVINFYKGIRLKDKAYIIMGILWSGVTVLDTAKYIFQLVG